MSEKCQLKTFSDNKLAVYTCDHVREMRDEWIEKFKKVNGTDEILEHGGRDRMYENYVRSLDEFLSQCTCENIKEKILPVCSKCAKEDHEGYFCRCEGRNIRLAKQMREEGKGAWVK